MVWAIEYTPRARKSLKKIDNTAQKRIKGELGERLATHHDPRVHHKVQKIKGWDNLFRYRVGDYRVLFEVYENKVVISVVNAGHRSEIYSGLKNIKEAERRGFGFGRD